MTDQNSENPQENYIEESVEGLNDSSHNDLDIENFDESQDFDHFDEGEIDLSSETDFSSDDENFDNHFDEPTPEKSQLNWFNIGVILVIGVAVAIAGYMFLFNQPSQNGTRAATNTAVNDPQALGQNIDNNVASEKPIANPLKEEIKQSGGLLSNPDLLDDTQNKEKIDQQNKADDLVFDALDAPPVTNDQDIEDIFNSISSNQSDKPSPPSVEVTDELPINNNNNDIQSDLLSLGEAVDTLPFPADNPQIPSNDNNSQLEPSAQNVFDLIEDDGPKAENNEANDNIVEDIEPQPLEDSRIEELSQNLNQLNNRIDDLTAQLENLVLANQTSNQIDTSNVEQLDLNTIKDSIQGLEKRLDNLSKAQNVKTVRPKVTVSSDSRVKKIAPKKQVIRAPQWDLRGAAPGQAYLAERGTQNLRTVSVGDSVKGIGTIQSIRLENGRWIVRGSAGIVTQ